MKPNEYHQFGRRLLDTLIDGMRSDGRLCDPITGEPVPANQYAATSFAVAAFRTAEIVGNRDYRDYGRRALNEFLERPLSDRGHGEFNTFALLEMLRDSKHGRYPLPVSTNRLRRAMRFESTPYSFHGNNFLLLQAVCRYYRHEMFESLPDSLQVRRILSLADHWQSSDGYLSDQHRLPIPPTESPLTYHAKQTMCYGRFSTAGVLQCEPPFRRGLAVLANASMQSGETLYYGRSENTLFGYASIFDAIDSLAKLDSELPNSVEQLRDNVWSYVRSFFDPDSGTCLPTGGRNGGDSIDGYVNNAVYGAYAAMLFSGIELSEECYPDQNSHENTISAPTGPPGVLSVSGANTELATAAQGEIKYTRSLPDPRYAGLTPLSFDYNGEPVCRGMPVDFDDVLSAPFQPVFTGEYHCSPVTYDSSMVNSSEYILLSGNASHFLYQHQSNREESSQQEQRSEIRRLLKTGARVCAERTRTILLYHWLKKRAVDIPAQTVRSLVYLPSYDCLIIATTIYPNQSALTIYPTSHLVAPGWSSAVTHQASFDMASTEHRTKTHKGEVVWTRHESVTIPAETFSTDFLIIDPANRIKDGQLSGEVEPRITVTLDTGSTYEVYLGRDPTQWCVE